jgi:S1-C subfamily serine protease
MADAKEKQRYSRWIQFPDIVASLLCCVHHFILLFINPIFVCNNLYLNRYTFAEMIKPKKLFLHCLMSNLFLLLPFLGSLSISAQSKQPVHSSNAPDYYTFLSGIRFIEIPYTPTKELDRIILEKNFGVLKNQNELIEYAVYSGVKKHFTRCGIEEVGADFVSQRKKFSSFCDNASVSVEYQPEDPYLKVMVTVTSCNNDWWQMPVTIYSPYNDWVDIMNDLEDLLNKNYGLNSIYNVKNRLVLNGDKTSWKEGNFIQYCESQERLSEIEGIFNCIISANEPEVKFLVVASGASFQIIYLNGGYFSQDWKEGDLIATLYPTAKKDSYKAVWSDERKHKNENCYISYENGILDVSLNGQVKKYIKTYPVWKKSEKSHISGTGFAINGDGLIATNFHVIEHMSKIIIRGVDGNFSKKFEADVLAVDKKNDLAILKIKSDTLLKINIPYTISSSQLDAGSNIYVLGYPLTNLMGEELKCTNGIVSAKSGYQGDITSYQLTAPIQPGNSGGPVFDYNGRVVAVINSLLSSGENVTYAIKSAYLLNLIEMAGIPFAKNEQGNVSGQVPDQVKKIRNFIYIVESD